MALNGVMALPVTLRFFTEIAKRAFQLITASSYVIRALDIIDSRERLD